MNFESESEYVEETEGKLRLLADGLRGVWNG